MLTTPAATITLACPCADLALVTLAGELDLAALEASEEVLAAAGRGEVVVDAAAVSFVGCCPLRPLPAAAAAGAAAARGSAVRPRRRRVVLAGGVVLELAEGGRVGGRTALALHGREGPASMAATVDHLGVEHQVIAATHPGWAGTERAASLDGVGALARAYLDLLVEGGAHDVVVVGACFGAWVAARMALADAEGRIGAVVLIAPMGLPAARRGQGAGPGRRRGAARSWRGRPPAPGGALRAYTGPVASDPTLAAALGAVAVPALVVRGSEDPVLDGAGASAWADALGAGRLAVIAGGGHLPCQRAPGATFAAIDTFLSPPLILSA